jgi:hypothetical protein
MHEQMNFPGMSMGTGGIPTTGNIPETTEKLRCPTDNIPDNRILKNLILSYSFEIKQIKRTHEYIFKVFFQNNVIIS